MTATLDSTTVAQYLTAHPQFFQEHAALLGEVKLASPLTGRTVSLQERQMEVMRDKYKALELRLSDLSRLAEENAGIAAKFHGWTQDLLRARGGAGQARAVLDGMLGHFAVPQATLRLWDLAPEHHDAWFAQGVSDDARLFANSLLAPYCGSNNDFEAVRWLGAGPVASTAMLALRAPDGNGAAFGLLILGSPDAQRFTAGMATDFLVNIGATASTALAPLRA
ncbi:uncharacterized protein ACFDR9_004403 [Janthinobacterium sp. CG_23.3]|uniref:DUF484 family protein n=1 Tax=unclassified Janthinobacterium TaxID=2610881 RepID=UPI00034B926C|nr:MULTISPECIES: DUF484 family protein [unclassified Janthinobacterium]MEC5158974.1 uncharacterized protein YigA (DUF484 family) [Janthinobacterium sp. CG_S6]